MEADGGPEKSRNVKKRMEIPDYTSYFVHLSPIVDCGMKKLFTSTTFLAVICCVLWASPFVPLKVGLQITPRPLEFAGYRFFLAGFFIALFYAFSRIGKAPEGDRGGYFTQVRRNFPKIALISVFHTSLLYTFFYMGQMRVEAAIGALVVGSQPLFVAVFAHLMRRDDRLSWRKTAAILLGLAGLTIIASGKVSGADFMGWTPVVGILFLVGNNMTSAFSNVLISRTRTDRLEPSVFSSSQLMLGGATLLAVSYATQGFHGFPTQGIWWASLAVLVFISTVAIGLWFVLLARKGVKVSELNMWKFLIPVVGSLESWILLPEEHPRLYSIVGLLVLTSSLVLLNYRSLHDVLFPAKKSE